MSEAGVFEALNSSKLAVELNDDERRTLARAMTLFDGVVVTDSVPPWRLRAEGAARARLHVTSAAPLFADAVRSAHVAWQRCS